MVKRDLDKKSNELLLKKLTKNQNCSSCNILLTDLYR